MCSRSTAGFVTGCAAFGSVLANLTIGARAYSGLLEEGEKSLAGFHMAPARRV